MWLSLRHAVPAHMRNLKFNAALVLMAITKITHLSGVEAKAVGALVFLAAAVISSFLSGTDQLLIFAVAMLLGYLIPGYIIRSLKNSENV